MKGTSAWSSTASDPRNTTPLTSTHLAASVRNRFDLDAYRATLCMDSAATAPLAYIAAQCDAMRGGVSGGRRGEPRADAGVAAMATTAAGAETSGATTTARDSHRISKRLEKWKVRAIRMWTSMDREIQNSQIRVNWICFVTVSPVRIYRGFKNENGRKFSSSGVT